MQTGWLDPARKPFWLTKMKTGIGIDVGTFHTVAVSSGSLIRIPNQSIPSRALRAGPVLIVGIDTISQLNSSFERILAPKLMLDDSNKKNTDLKEVIQKLVEQALQGLGMPPNNIVLTVPPGWSLAKCNLLEAAVNELGYQVRFMHEPIALLISAMYLAPKLTLYSDVAKLDKPSLVMVCDWGAGTVDLALVKVSRVGNIYEFSCLDEVTEIGQGGTSLARDIVRNSVSESGKKGKMQIDVEADFLQLYWQGDKFASLDFSDYSKPTKDRRQYAATVVANKIETLVNNCSILDRTEILFLLHGGPLESEELCTRLKEELKNSLGVNDEQFVHVGENFAKHLSDTNVLWRRDVLVAAGASLFASRGDVLPEFQYEIALINSFGGVSSKIILKRDRNTEGIRVITPPYSGTDYSVSVQQVRGSIATSVCADLHIHVRPNALVMYRILEAGVGYATLEALEAQDLPHPVPFSDSRSDCQRFPERSARFSIDLG
jgi:hypothetical protein